MAQAVWKKIVLADSDATVVVEGNHYFPPEPVRWDHLEASDKRSVCPWKGSASYYDVVVDGAVNRNAAWLYPRPSPAAAKIAGYLAFWHGVSVAPSHPDGHRRRALPFPSRRRSVRPTPSSGQWNRR
ncbi:MAG: DUF427 domain-containing protein [Acidimicrobiales bacterium]